MRGGATNRIGQCEFRAAPHVAGSVKFLPVLLQMRSAILISVLLFVLGVFTFTRGTGWHYGYMAAGAMLGLFGLFGFGLLVTGSNSAERQNIRRTKKHIETRPGRVRAVPEIAK